jgi:hypothetical protein
LHRIGGILSSGGELEFLHAFVRGGSLHSCMGRSLSPDLCFVLYSFADGVEPFFLTLRSPHFEHLVSVVLSRCPCLRGPRLAISSDLVLAFDQLCDIFICLFSFSFLSELVTMCVVNALIKGKIEDLSRPRTGGWSLPGVMSD